MAPRKHPLVGTWTLVSCEHRLSDGSLWHPLGENPLGRLVYTPDGAMIVMLMRSDRPRFSSAGLFEGTPEELAAAGEGFIAYSGRCEVRAGKASHRVDMSFFPNWIGTTQLRAYRLKGRRVAFTTRSFSVRGVRQTARLVWERV